MSSADVGVAATCVNPAVDVVVDGAAAVAVVVAPAAGVGVGCSGGYQDDSPVSKLYQYW